MSSPTLLSISSMTVLDIDRLSLEKQKNNLISHGNGLVVQRNKFKCYAFATAIVYGFNKCLLPQCFLHPQLNILLDIFFSSVIL